MDENPPEVEYTDTAVPPRDPWTRKTPPATFKELEIIVEPEEEVRRASLETVLSVECLVVSIVNSVSPSAIHDSFQYYVR